MNKYAVRVSYTASEVYVVEASSLAEAMYLADEMARDEFDLWDGDWETEEEPFYFDDDGDDWEDA